MKYVLVSLLFGVLVSACGSGASEAAVSRADCEDLRAHVVELRLSGVAKDHDAAEMDKHRANLAASLGGSFVDECVERTPAYVECALGATSREALSSCP